MDVQVSIPKYEAVRKWHTALNKTPLKTRTFLKTLKTLDTLIFLKTVEN